MASILAFIQSIGSLVTTVALVSFVLLNVGFVAMIAMRRDRSLVNRFTKPLIVADTVLLLAAGGAPVASWGLQAGAKAVAAVIPGNSIQVDKGQSAGPTDLDPITGVPGRDP